MTPHPFHSIHRRALLKSAVAASVAGFCGRAWAAYPDRPVKIIVPWAAGGSTDALARAISQRLGELLKQPVLVDNKPGAAGQIGTDAAAKAAPDGYTLAIVELPHAIAPAVVAKLPYDLLRDFTPITLLGTAPLVLFTGASAAAKDVAGFVRSMQTAREAPAMAHSGSGSLSHLAGELFAQASKVKFTQIPYRGSAPALADVAGGQVAAHFATLASGLGLMQGGKIRALATTGRKRSDVPVLRNVPTLAEAGYRNFEINQWWALVAPATMPLDIADRLRSEVIGAMSDARTIERLSTLGIDLRGTSRDQLRGFMRDESTRWQAVARGIGLQPQ